MGEQDEFQTYVGREAEPPRVARYAVNAAMITNWVEAHDDPNPVYQDRDAALSAGLADVVCPPAMISTWVMSGYKRWREVQRNRAAGEVEGFAYSHLMAELDRAGYTSVVATDVEQTYGRELHPGDHITAYYSIDSISEPKQTGLGEGRFITLLKHYCDADGEMVAEEHFRLLRFRPRAKEGS